MKPKLSNFTIAVFFILITSAPTICQDWNWRWAKGITCQNPIFGTGPGPIACDFFNNNYFVAVYNNTLVLPDTTFYHSGQGLYSYNCRSVVKYNPNGEYQNALDMYVIPEGSLPDMNVGIDKQLDLYISLSFSQGFNILDSVFEPYYWQCPYGLDGLVIKLSPNFNILWAKYIGGYAHDNIYHSVVTPNGDIFMNAVHGADEWGTQVIFFDQDTIFSPDQFSTVCKLDKDGNLKWLLDFYGDVSGHHMEMGENGKLLWWGVATTDIVHNGDTTFIPNDPQYYNYPFCATITQDGFIEDIRFVSFPGVFGTNYAMTASGEKYITATVSDTVVILGDTTIIPVGYYRLIGKLNDQFEPLWYHIIPRINTNQHLGVINIALDEDNLVFSIATDDDLHIADTVMPIYYGYEGFFGEFDTDGNLKYIMRTESNHSNYPLRMMLDNCKNPLIGGSFIGTSIFGKDTITCSTSDPEDIYFAKLERVPNSEIYLGPDTLACAEHTLYGPAGYSYYSWNNTISSQSSYTTTETGTITFACANEEGCWLYDTVNITIHPGFEINLGSDTTISPNESLVFTVPYGYESYLWSNSVTDNSITIFGESYEPGMVIQVWVAVTDGPCVISDTVYVTIKNEFAVEDFSEINISLYPNPFNDCIYINSGSEINQIDILSLQGLCLISKEILNPDREIIKIHLEDLKQGVYFLKLISGESESIKKIVKL
jgi:hypothetical protein